MKVPQLKKKLEIKSCHNIEWEDNYSWIHQKNILEVLKDKSKLDSEVKKYLEDENAYTDYHLKDTKDIQKKIKTLLEFETLKSVVNKIANETNIQKKIIYSEALKIKDSK